MKAILFDLDGVLYQGGSVLAGAVETLDWVRREGIDHLFLTNTSSRPRAAIRENLLRMGYRVRSRRSSHHRWPLVIGDDIRGDIGGAQGAGIRGLLVRSGKFRPWDLRGEIQPDGVIDSIADLPAWWVESLLSF